MYNPQMYADALEFFLRPRGFASTGDADRIRSNPLDFLEKILEIIETQNPSCESRTADFWDKYEKHCGKRMDEIDESVVREMVSDFKSLFS